MNLTVYLIPVWEILCKIPEGLKINVFHLSCLFLCTYFSCIAIVYFFSAGSVGLRGPKVITSNQNNIYGLSSTLQQNFSSLQSSEAAGELPAVPSFEAPYTSIVNPVSGPVICIEFFQ